MGRLSTKSLSATMSCIFCHREKLAISGENDRFLIIKDIKPAVDHHYLVIPKQHYQNIKYLEKEQISLIQEMKQSALEFAKSNIPEMDANMLRLGFHWAPFNTIRHLHLHVLYPQNQMSWLQSWIFRPNSYWFIDVDKAIEYLSQKDA